METVGDERVLHESPDRSLTVTTRRVRLARRGFGRVGRVTSFLIEDIDGIEYGLERRPILLQLAVVALVLGSVAAVAAEEGEMFFLLGVFPAVLLVAAYMVVRKRGLRIHAGRLTLHLPRFPGGVLAAQSLIDAIERARLEPEEPRKGPRFAGWATHRTGETSPEAASGTGAATA
jgi:hypothetical protein